MIMEEREEIDLSAFGGKERFAAIYQVLSRTCHPTLPKCTSTAISADKKIGTINTIKDDPDETMFASVHTSMNALMIVDAFWTVCSALDTLHCAGVVHGAVHETNVFYSAKTGAFVLRGFSEEDAHTNADTRAAGHMIMRIAGAHSLAMQEIIDALLTDDLRRAMNGLQRARACHVQFSAHCIQQRHADIANNLAARSHMIPVAIDSNFEAMSTAIVLSVHGAIAARTMQIPFFHPRGTPARGLGPCVQVLGAFFRGLVEREIIVIDGDYAWPTFRAHERLCSRELFHAIGNLIMFAACMDISLGVRFSPVLLRLMLAEKASVSDFRSAIVVDHEQIRPRVNEISQMHYGAAPYRKYLAANGWNADFLLANDGNSIAPLRAYVRCVDMNAKQRETLFKWCDRHPESREKFMVWMSGGTSAGTVTLCGVETAETCSEEVLIHSACVRTCMRTAWIPAALMNDYASCERFFAEQLRDVRYFNAQ